MLVVLTNYILGKEMAWDTLNYHLYAGFSAVNDRFNQDYFAAGPQSYFNPYAYVPFYAMVRAGFSALAIGSVLAAIHSVILWLTFDLALLVCPSPGARSRLLFGVCAVAMALINPILIQQFGSSFADITTGEIVLGGWLLLAGAVREPTVTRLISGGIMLGAAAALKPTNAVHAICASTMLIFVPDVPRKRVYYILACVGSVALGFAIVAAAWSCRLEASFGNPFFPLLNNIFRSPEFTTEKLRHFRFIPEDLTDALWRPFAMISPSRMVHEELRAPESRYAVLLILTAIFLGDWWWRRRAIAVKLSILPPNCPISARVLLALSCAFVTDWVFWLAGSGNSRYFLPLSCVCAVLIVALLFRLFANRAKARNYILVAIFASQTIQLWMNAEFRWTPVPWGGPWFDLVVPEVLAKQPNLYLTEGAASNSFLAPYLAPGSGLVNFSGGYTLAHGGANGAKVESLIKRFEPNLRVLTRGEKLYEDDDWRAPRRSHIDDALERFGLRVDPGDCAIITVNGLPPELEIRVKHPGLPTTLPSPDRSYLVSCRVLRRTTESAPPSADERSAGLALDNLEDACPELFQPRRVGTEHDKATWRRFYSNTDITAWVSYGSVKFQDPINGDSMVTIGRVSDWAKAPQALACGRRGGHYFARAFSQVTAPLR